MSYAIKRTPAARADLRSIACYTHDTWGKDQLRIYMKELESTIQTLTEKPKTSGKDRGNTKAGLRSISHKSHYYVFYRVN